MSYWGKIVGAVAGFAMGGPPGALLGAALGHAADSGVAGSLGAFAPSRITAMFAQRDQLFAICVVVLAARLAKCDGPVNRFEIDAFKRHFRIPPGSGRDIGRLFDQARDSSEPFEQYASQLGEAFADNRGMLEDVLTALFAIARADRPITQRELDFLTRVHQRFGLDRLAWENARGGIPRARSDDGPDPYAVLGATRQTSDEELRAVWKRLMRENHPDSLASRGVPPEFIARAGDKVASINAAWDRIKRERGL